MVTGGDAIGELVRRRGLGQAVAATDDEAFAAACASLIGDNERYDEAERVRELAPSLRWSAVAEPLVRFCVEHEDRPPRRPAQSALARATFGQYPAILADAREQGGLGEIARRVPRHFTRLVRHRGSDN